MTNADFTCGVCSFSNPDIDAVKNHRARAHSNKAQREGSCALCGELVSGSFEFHDHFFEEHAQEYKEILERAADRMDVTTSSLSAVFLVGFALQPTGDSNGKDGMAFVWDVLENFLDDEDGTAISRSRLLSPSALCSPSESENNVVDEDDIIIEKEVVVKDQSVEREFIDDVSSQEQDEPLDLSSRKQEKGAVRETLKTEQHRSRDLDALHSIVHGIKHDDQDEKVHKKVALSSMTKTNKRESGKLERKMKTAVTSDPTKTLTDLLMNPQINQPMLQTLLGSRPTFDFRLLTFDDGMNPAEVDSILQAQFSNQESSLQIGSASISKEELERVSTSVTSTHQQSRGINEFSNLIRSVSTNGPDLKNNSPCILDQLSKRSPSFSIPRCSTPAPLLSPVTEQPSSPIVGVSRTSSPAPVLQPSSPTTIHRPIPHRPVIHSSLLGSSTSRAISNGEKEGYPDWEKFFSTMKVNPTLIASWKNNMPNLSSSNAEVGRVLPPADPLQSFPVVESPPPTRKPRAKKMKKEHTRDISSSSGLESASSSVTLTVVPQGITSGQRLANTVDYLRNAIDAAQSSTSAVQRTTHSSAAQEVALQPCHERLVNAAELLCGSPTAGQRKELSAISADKDVVTDAPPFPITALTQEGLIELIRLLARLHDNVKAFEQFFLRHFSPEYTAFLNNLLLGNLVAFLMFPECDAREQHERGKKLASANKDSVRYLSDDREMMQLLNKTIYFLRTNVRLSEPLPTPIEMTEDRMQEARLFAINLWCFSADIPFHDSSSSTHHSMTSVKKDPLQQWITYKLFESLLRIFAVFEEARLLLLEVDQKLRAHVGVVTITQEQMETMAIFTNKHPAAMGICTLATGGRDLASLNAILQQNSNAGNSEVSTPSASTCSNTSSQRPFPKPIAMAAPLPLDGSPLGPFVITAETESSYQKDIEYLSVEEKDKALCPRGCDNADKRKGKGERAGKTRKCHYRTYHYDVYYLLGNGGANQWDKIRFGNEQGKRICVYCGSGPFYDDRAKLVEHMQEIHQMIWEEIRAEFLAHREIQVDASLRAMLMCEIPTASSTVTFHTTL